MSGPAYPYSEPGAWLMHCQIQEAYAAGDNEKAWEIEKLWDEIEQARFAADEAANRQGQP